MQAQKNMDIALGKLIKLGDLLRAPWLIFHLRKFLT